MANKPKTQNEIIALFLEGATEGRSGSGGNLVIRGNQLIHYQTVIAERDGNKILLNYTRYSLVTGRIQKRIKEVVPAESLIQLGRIEINYMGSLTEKLSTEGRNE